jgi:hypothetical protein
MNKLKKVKNKQEIMHLLVPALISAFFNHPKSVVSN